MRPITILLRGERVTVKNVSIEGPDRAAGILGRYVESYTLHDAQGNELDCYDSLTDEESKSINDAIHDVMDTEEREYEQILDARH
jgi:hypothetical protein